MDSQDSVSSFMGGGVDGPPPIDLSSLPPTYVLTTHLNTTTLSDTEDLLLQCGAPLTHDPTEARIFLGNIEQKRRAIFDLRSLDVATIEVIETSNDGNDAEDLHGPAKKKRRIDGEPKPAVVTIEDSSTESEPDATAPSENGKGIPARVVLETTTRTQISTAQYVHVPETDIVVVKLSWLKASTVAAHIEPLENYILYRGHRLSSEANAIATPRSSPPMSSPISQDLPTPSSSISILARARADLGPERGQSPSAFASTTQLHRRGHPHAKVSQSNKLIPHLLHETTSEHETLSSSQSQTLPPLPGWITAHDTYSCKRSTPASSPNAPFLAQLKIIRTTRKLTGDEIGVRAYSTAIAAVAAYPHAITSAREVLRLPGCEGKIAALWSEWRDLNGGSRAESEEVEADAETGARGAVVGTVATTEGGDYEVEDGAHPGVLVSAAAEAMADERLKVLRRFYDIWGVGDKTARDFYAAGWRDLDDVVEYGWGSLSRVQQIGVKYYDEFLLKIPRTEVEFIAEMVHKAARKVVQDPEGVRSCIVGGYRRGKAESGDVDVIVSHLDERETLDFVQEIVRVLMDEGWVTHELITATTGSKRGQATLPYRGAGGGHGFDTLDKALVVWQDPSWPGREKLPGHWTREQIQKKNPNVHRRVDIIIAPWSKVGCAVLGWSAGTTFERDLRRYAKHVKNWKFDSSGVRDRATGQEVDLENVGGRPETPEEAERKVFEGMGLVYRAPWERCTG